MSNRLRLLVCALLLSAFCTPSVLADPISRYYLTAAGQDMNFEVQGPAIVNSWAQQSPTNEFAIAISGGTIKTTSYYAGETGAEYGLAGNYTGNNYTCPMDYIYDGTSDGTYNYTVAHLSGNVYRTDLDWQNAVLLFSIGEYGLGITYDGSNDSLWVSTWFTGTVINYTMAGAVLSAFAPYPQPTCLALDPADDTLWMGDYNNEGTFYQFSKAGALLDSVTYPGLASFNTLGGEMVVPEPGTYVLLGLGLAGLALWRRKK